MRKILLLLTLFMGLSVLAQDDFSYQTPPKDIQDLLLAKPTPGVSIDSKREWILLIERSSYPTIEDLAQPELRIAGLRLNPKNFGPSRAGYSTNLQLKNIKKGSRAEVIAKYRAWIVVQPALMNALGELRSRDLVCWCAPLACHGDVLVEPAKRR